MARRGDPKRFADAVDMTGALIRVDDRSSWRVLERVANVKGNARFNCLHSCGETMVLLGTRLRRAAPKYCDSCRPKRRVGRVARLALLKRQGGNIERTARLLGLDLRSFRRWLERAGASRREVSRG